jgi:hypothetical protein
MTVALDFPTLKYEISKRGQGFVPIRMSLPSQDTLQFEPFDVEEVWYQNITKDVVYEYRTVELPIHPDRLITINRNLSEVEWRSIGIVMSPGWENFYRSADELNIFSFRRVLPGQESEAQKRLRSELEDKIGILERNKTNLKFISKIYEMILYPMKIFDSANINLTSLPHHPVYITTPDDLIEYLIRLYRSSVNSL